MAKDPTDRPRPPEDLVEDPGETYDPRDRSSEAVEAEGASPSWDVPTEFHGISSTAVVKADRDEAAGPRFRFRRVVGRGGMGEVWEATQISLGRPVAVKRILSSRKSDDKIDEARREFRLEAVITAALEHPNIVPVHDLVQDASGEPLIAMKMVGGENWARQCDADFDSLPVADYLAKHLPVLVDVGHAVAFAHSRGIVHRDVKLSQVMLGEYGEVLLMDWGLAIRLDDVEPEGGMVASTRERDGRIRDDALDASVVEDLDLPTRNTARSPMGTPALMAPEQTRPTADGVGTWTDVYLLGGCLYRLLTGSYPHRAESGRDAFKLAAAGVIETPSDRNPDREIPEELEILCLEALSPLPGGRPSSAMAFVGRLQDFLSGAGRRRESETLTHEVAEILETGAGSYSFFNDCLTQLDRAVSLWGANPVVPGLRDLAHSGCSKLALGGGDLALARLQAEQIGEEGARSALLGEVDAAEHERRRRETQRKWALAAAAALLVVVVVGSLGFSRRLAAERDLAVAARDDAERQKAITFESLEGTSSLVNYMLGSLRERLDLERDKDREVARAVGEGVFDYYRRVDTSEFSSELALEHADQLSQVGGQFSDLGLVEESIELLEKGLGLQGRFLTQDDSALAPTLVRLGESYERLEMWDEAIAVLDRVEEISDSNPATDPLIVARGLRRRGLVLTGMAEYEAAEAAFRAAYEMTVAEAGEDDPRIVSSARALGDLLFEVGRYDEARGYLEAALLLAESYPGERRIELIETNMAVAALDDQMGEHERAIELYQRAIDIASEEFGPDDRMVGMSLFGLGNVYEHMDDYVRADAVMKRGLKVFEAYYPPNHHEIGLGIVNYAGIQIHLKDYEGAVRSYQRVLEIFAAAYGPFHKHTAVAHGELATAYRRWGKLELSREQYLEAVKSLEGGVGLEGFGAGVLFNNLAGVEGDMGRYDDADEHYRRSLEILTKIVGEEHNGVLQIRMNHAAMLSDRGSPNEALAIIENVVEIRRRTVGPEHPEFAKALSPAADELVILGRLEEAEALYREVLRIRQTSYGQAHRLTSATVSNLASLLSDQDRHDEAIALKTASLEGYRSDFGDDDGRTGMANNSLGRSLDAAGRTEEALRQFEVALAICNRAYGAEHPETLTVMGNLGSVLVELGRLGEAGPYLVVAYEKRKALGGGADAKVGRSAMALARLRSAEGDREAATVLMNEALGIFEAVLGPESGEAVACREERDELMPPPA